MIFIGYFLQVILLLVASFLLVQPVRAYSGSAVAAVNINNNGNSNNNNANNSYCVCPGSSPSQTK